MQDFNKQLKELDKLAKKAAKELEKSDPDWIDMGGVVGTAMHQKYRVIFERDGYVGVQWKDDFSHDFPESYLFTVEVWDTVRDSHDHWLLTAAKHDIMSHDLKDARKWCARHVNAKKHKDHKWYLVVPVLLLLINMACCIIFLTLGGSSGLLWHTIVGVVYLLTSCALSVSLFIRYETGS